MANEKRVVRAQAELTHLKVLATEVKKIPTLVKENASARQERRRFETMLAGQVRGCALCAAVWRQARLPLQGAEVSDLKNQLKDITDGLREELRALIKKNTNRISVNEKDIKSIFERLAEYDKVVEVAKVQYACAPWEGEFCCA